MTNYRNNHYVPQWYQEGFIPADETVRNLQYLNLQPDSFTTSNGLTITDKSVKPLGASKCFAQDDLYTRWFGEERNTAVEQQFFGLIDSRAIDSICYLENYDHRSISYETIEHLMPYLGTQRIRTPRGLAWIAEKTDIEDKNSLMAAMASLRAQYSAIWAECIWQVADADISDTKFIISDNPVTVYNRKIGTHNRTWDRDKSDPDLTLMGSHTVFPLTMNKVLILTHPGWAKNPFQNGMIRRPNIRPDRPTVFNYMQIQIDRHLNEEEVREINFIIKSKAQRYVAAYKKDWLYPEEYVDRSKWRDFGDGLLLLPDPRSLHLGGEVFFGFSDGSAYAQDQWGQPPQMDSQPVVMELDTLNKIQGLFAHKFGATRRGRSFNTGSLEQEVDSDRIHQMFLRRYKPRGSEAKRLKMEERGKRKNTPI